MDFERFQIAEVTFKVTGCHWQCLCLVDHMRLTYRHYTLVTVSTSCDISEIMRYWLKITDFPSKVYLAIHVGLACCRDRRCDRKLKVSGFHQYLLHDDGSLIKIQFFTIM